MAVPLCTHGKHPLANHPPPLPAPQVAIPSCTHGKHPLAFAHLVIKTPMQAWQASPSPILTNSPVPLLAIPLCKHRTSLLSSLSPHTPTPRPPSPTHPHSQTPLASQTLTPAGATAEESADTNSRQAGGGGPAPLPHQAGLCPQPLSLQGPV